VAKIEPQGEARPEDSISFPPASCAVNSRDPHSLDLVRQAMLADVQHPEGTGHRASISAIDLRQDRNRQIAEDSNHLVCLFTPYENPQYAVVVVVSGAGGFRVEARAAPSPADLPGIDQTRHSQHAGPQPLAERRIKMFESSLNQREPRTKQQMLVALLGLMILGAAFIYSATSVNESARQLAWYRQPCFKQVVFYVIVRQWGWEYV